MGVPKRRVSHARRGESRAHLAIDLPTSRSVRTATSSTAAPRLSELRFYQGRLAVPPKPVSSSGDAAQLIV